MGKLMWLLVLGLVIVVILFGPLKQCGSEEYLGYQTSDCVRVSMGEVMLFNLTGYNLYQETNKICGELNEAACKTKLICKVNYKEGGEYSVLSGANPMDFGSCTPKLYTQ